MDVLQAFQHAAEDREHGASEIEMALLRSLLRTPERWTLDSFGQGARILERAQPMMANLRSLAARVAAPEHGLERLKEMLEQRLAVLTELPRLLLGHAWPVLAEAPRLYSISRSSAVRELVAGAARKGWIGRVVVFDGSAAGGGIRQAEDLRALGVSVRSEPDARMAPCLGEDGGLVVVGADAVGAQHFLNATGTCTLLELAALRRLPTVLVADSAKNVGNEMLDEVLAAGPCFEDSSHGRCWPVFERCSLALVGRRIDEEGCHSGNETGNAMVW